MHYPIGAIALLLAISGVSTATEEDDSSRSIIAKNHLHEQQQEQRELYAKDTHDSSPTIWNGDGHERIVDWEDDGWDSYSSSSEDDWGHSFKCTSKSNKVRDLI